MSADDTLTLSPSRRRVDACADKLRGFRAQDGGYAYIEYEPQTPPDRLLPEDLAVTLAFNSRASGTAFRSLMRRAADLDLSVLPDKCLHETTSRERETIAGVICEVTTWEGFQASLATKTLHKKRPALIPVLDNRAIFESYLNPQWPTRRTVGDSIRSRTLITIALEAMVRDLTDDSNAPTWKALREVDPRLTRVEALDMVWWMHFRSMEPVRRPR
jgi:hypothetical protein